MRFLVLLVAVFVTWFVGFSPSSSAGQTTTTYLLAPTFWETATLESVRAEIARGADLNVRDKDGNTSLHWAAVKTVTPAIITMLVAAGADPNAQDEDGLTPLHRAAVKTDTPAIITALVAAGADPNARFEYSASTPLHWAVRNAETPAIITALVAAGADPNARDKDGETPLHWAALWSSTPAIITALVEAGANPKARANDGKTPLDIARKHNYYPTVRQTLARVMTSPAHTPPVAMVTPAPKTPTLSPPYFTSSVVNVGVNLTLRDGTLTVGSLTENTYAFDSGLKAGDQLVAIEGEATKGMTLKQARQKLGGSPGTKANLTVRRKGAQTPLTFSLTRQVFQNKRVFWETATPESVKAEIARGANPNARGKDGSTSLHWATAYPTSSAIITALVEAGADPNARATEYNITPLHVAAQRIAPAIITALVAAGADPNARAKNDATPLHSAAQWTTTPANITALVEAGVDPNARDEDGKTPLHWAAKFATTTAIITALVAAGADPNARATEYGNTPLHLAAQKTDNPAIITALVEAGADPNAWNKDDATPLHLAAALNATPAIITALVAAGADPNARDKHDRTPLYAAARQTNNPAIITALVEAGADPNARYGNRTLLDLARKHNDHPAVRQTLARAVTAHARTPPVAKVSPVPKTPTLSPAPQFPTVPVAVQFTQAPVRHDDIAVIIGNADYTTLGQDIPDVKPAYADAEGIKRYVTQALGVREGNIIYLKNATGSQMDRVFGNKEDPKGQLYDWVQPHSRVFVYYSGHGAPMKEDGSAYLVPVDADSRRIHLNGYPLATLHRNLAYLPVESVTLVLEACFSGASAAGDVIPKSSRITVAAAPVVPQNVTVITAGAADQLASWEEDDSHGLFTKYFLLGMSGQADGNGDGRVTLTELEPYLKKTLTYYARRYYGRDQVAQIKPAAK